MPHCKKQMISFFLTTRCNLSCVYCYNSDERRILKEHFLPLHIAKAGIDEFFQKSQSRHIRFYGPGEPTQAFDLMCQITEYAKSVSTGVTVEIQTNGVFSPRVRQWILDAANIVWLSFDGPPDIQDHNRPVGGSHPSSPIIEENTRWLNANKGTRNLMIGARVTMTDKNIDRQKEMIDYFSGLGIKYIWTDPLFPAVGTCAVCFDEEKKHEYHFDMERYVDNYIEAYKYANEKKVFYGSFLTCNFDGESNVHCRACTPVPHLTPDGYVSACDMVVLGEAAHHMDCFVYGKWDETSNTFAYDEAKITQLQHRTSDALRHCRDCEARLHCGGYCLGEVVNETNSLYGCKPAVCKAVRRLLREIGSHPTPFDYLHP